MTTLTKDFTLYMRHGDPIKSLEEIVAKMELFQKAGRQVGLTTWTLDVKRKLIDDRDYDQKPIKIPATIFTVTVSDESLA